MSKHTAMRILAYCMATLFMILMVVRGVALSSEAMEDDADRAVTAAFAALTAMATSGTLDPAQARVVLEPLAVTGVTLRVEDNTNSAPPVADEAELEYRQLPLGNNSLTLIATIDHGAISRTALQRNLPYIGFVLALGLPTIMIFLYIGWAVNKPALQLLLYAQAELDGAVQPPKLPAIWESVLARLKDLRSSQAQMQAFLDHVPIGIIFRDTTGKPVMINRYGETFYKQGLADPALLEHASNDGNSSIEIELRGPSGEPIHLLVKSFPVLNKSGSIELLGNFFVDVTDQRSAEADLAESRARFEAFFNHAPAAMYIRELDGRLVLVNQWAAQMYGQTPERMVGMLASAVRNPADKTRAASADEELRRTGKPQVGEYEYTLPGKTVIGKCTTFPILDRQGEVSQIGALIIDTTEEHHTQAALTASRENLHQSEKLAALGSMLAGVSHELNNPLAAVIGQTALLGEDLEGTEHAERINKIRRAADRCARIVQSFLAMARQKAPEYRSVDINRQVQSAVELTEYQMRAANVGLDLQLQESMPMIAADPDQLHQVIVNLLNNARQALESKVGDRKIVLCTASYDGMVSMSIADNGMGIDAASRERIFDPFFTTKDVGSGTGIGLSYSLGIIEAHGGTLQVEDSDLADGAVFVIRLPIRDQAAASVNSPVDEPAAATGRVLVIDDEEDVADTLADMLARMGLTAKVAIGGIAGLAVLADGAEYDLILSDIRMPDCDGSALYDWLLQNRPDLAGRIAFVTGDTLSGIAADFLAMSRCPVLEKPFTPSELRALVATVLEP